MSEPNPWSRDGGQPSEPQPPEPQPPHQDPSWQQPPFQDPGYQQQPPHQDPSWQQPPYQDQGSQPPYGTPWPEPTYQQPSWAAGAYGQPSPYGFAPQPHKQGTAVFVLGVLSIVCAFFCGSGLVLGIIALALSGAARREINANPAAYTNGQKVRAGRICAIVGIVISALALLGRLSQYG